MFRKLFAGTFSNIWALNSFTLKWKLILFWLQILLDLVRILLALFILCIFWTRKKSNIFMSWRRWRRSPKRSQEIDFSSDIKTERRYNHHIEYLSSFHLKATSKFHPIKLGKQSLSYSRHHFKGCIPGTVKVWDEGIENYLQRKLMNVPCLQPKGVNWIKVRPNFHRRNLSFCLGLHNCRPFCCTFFQYNLQRGSPSNALPWCIHTAFESIVQLFDDVYKFTWLLDDHSQRVSVFMWFTHERPGRNPACSFLIPFSRTSIILVKMILQKTLLATQRRLMLLQFIQLDGSPWVSWRSRLFSIYPG